MKQIRHNVFETNSSSTHSIVICDKYLYDEWNADRAYFNKYTEDLVKDVPEGVDQYDIVDYLTRSEFDNAGGEELCSRTFKDSNGVCKIAVTIEIHD